MPLAPRTSPPAQFLFARSITVPPRLSVPTTACSPAPPLVVQAGSGLYPAVSQVTPAFHKPTHVHRNDLIRSMRQGCDTGPDPPYLEKANAEPRHEVAGGLWHEDRGREGRKIVAPGGAMRQNRFGQPQRAQQQQPEGAGEAAAGLPSNAIHAHRKSRTGLKYKKDCWGNPIPQ